MPERADFRPEKADFRPERADFRPERAWGGRTDGRTNEQKSPVFYRTSSPSGPLPCLSFQFTTMQSRAMGIADHCSLSFLTNCNFNACLRVDKHDSSQHSNTDINAVGVFIRSFLPSWVRPLSSETCSRCPWICLCWTFMT